jgi:hypothetical protein
LEHDLTRNEESHLSLQRSSPLNLYRALKALAPEEVRVLVCSLKPIQRQLLRDIDFWKKDVLDVHSFEYWVNIYSHVPKEEILLEFLKAEDFLFYLKSVFTISTFDVEDPQYPDHDNSYSKYYMFKKRQTFVNFLHFSLSGIIFYFFFI